MNLYLVQHGKAVAKEVDPDRSLTGQGRVEVKKVAAFIERLNLTVGWVWHSGKTRAAQTARILAEVVKADKGVLQRDGLAPRALEDRHLFLFIFCTLKIFNCRFKNLIVPFKYPFNSPFDRNIRRNTYTL